MVLRRPRLAEVCDEVSWFSVGVQLNYRHYFLVDRSRGEFSLDVRLPIQIQTNNDGASWWQGLAALDLGMPDVRWEFVDGGPDGVVLSLPVAVTVYAEKTFSADLFIEPQYRTKKHAWRGILGTRAAWVPIAKMIGPMVEAGGLIGTDGSGAMLGTGLVLAFDYNRGDSISSLATVYRRIWTNQGDRHDVSLDLRYAFGTGF